MPDDNLDGLDKKAPEKDLSATGYLQREQRQHVKGAHRSLTRRPGRPANVRSVFGGTRDQRLHGPNRFEKINEMELEQILALIRCGTSPATATIQILGINRTSFYNWMQEADKGHEKKLAFMTMLEKAQAEARSLAERRVTVSDPLAALSRGPLGRTVPGYPGWSEERTVKHTDPSGEGPPVLRVQIVVERMGIRSVEQAAIPTEAKRLSEGDEP